MTLGSEPSREIALHLSERSLTLACKHIAAFGREVRQHGDRLLRFSVGSARRARAGDLGCLRDLTFRKSGCGADALPGAVTRALPRLSVQVRPSLRGRSSHALRATH